MPESVECIECGHRYDSDTQPFCPRCGSTKQGTDVAPAVAQAARRHPSRTRLQVGGIMMATISSALLILFVAAFVAMDVADAGAYAALEGQPGGDVQVQVTRGDAPVANASVRFLATNGSGFQTGTTDANGTFEATSQHAYLKVEVQADNATWHRLVLSLPGATREVPFDLEAPAGEQPPLVLSDTEKTQLRVFSAFLALFFAAGVAAGVAAIRARPRALAVFGSLTALVPPVILLFAMPVAGLLPLLLMAVAAGLIIGNRRAMS